MMSGSLVQTDRLSAEPAASVFSSDGISTVTAIKPSGSFLTRDTPPFLVSINITIQVTANNGGLTL